MGPKLFVLISLASTFAFAQGATPAESVPQKHVCTDISRTEVVPCPGERTAAPAQPTPTSASPSAAAPAPAPAPAAATSQAAAENFSKSSKSNGRNALAADAPPDVNLTGAADLGAHRASLRDLPLNFLQDQRNFLLTPARAHTSDLNLLLPFAATTAVLAGGVDRGIESHLPTSPSTISRSKSLSNYGAAAMGAGVGGAWLLGQIRGDDHMKEAAMLSGEAAVDSLLISEGAKYAFGRQRPQIGSGHGDFFSGGDSFPSLHTAAAFSIATVMSEEYPSPFMKFLTYGAASGIAATRLTSRQHFASDVLVGAGLGWLEGRQVYHAHHQNDGDLKRWGTFERYDGEHASNSSLGSPYVPLDSWIYPAFDRLQAMGLVHGGFAGMRPWTRLMCAELLEDSAGSFENDDQVSKSAAQMYRELQREFAPELDRRSERNLQARVESIYTRVTAISGPPLTDGYHFGQTIINDFGRPYQEGFNNVTGASGYATAGPFTLYVRGEYQHAAEGSVLPLAARQAIGQSDLLPTPPPVAAQESDNFTLLEAYAGVNMADWQLSFGRQSLWWGPGEGGPMMFSDNAAPITMLRFNRVRAVKLPSVLGWFGPFRTEAFLGRLEGFQFMDTPSGLVGSWTSTLADQPFIHGQRISFQPTENFEFGFSRTTLFGGTGYPVTAGTFWRSLTSTSNVYAGQPNKPGDRRSGLDFSYRLPKLRNWLTFYGDGFTEDEYSPVAYWDRSVWHAGLHMPEVPGIRQLELRAEGGYTDNPLGGQLGPGYYYNNVTWRSGYRNSGNLIGSWLGRAGQGATASATYNFSAQYELRFEFRHQKISNEFLLGGGTLTDGAIRASLWRTKRINVFSLLQYEQWRIPVISAGPRTDVATSIQVTYRSGKP